MRLDPVWAGLLAVAIVVVFVVHEFAQAAAAERLGDPSPSRWGRRSLDPRRHADPFGSILLPLLGIALAAAGSAFPVFAYGRPMPSDPRAFRDGRRGPVLVALAGPIACLLVAAIAGAVLRFGASLGLSPSVAEAAVAFLWVGATMTVLNLMPIPGLDGSRILVRLLPPRAAEVYGGLDGYLPLFILVLFFVLSGSLLGIVRTLTSALCLVLAGVPAC